MNSIFKFRNKSLSLQDIWNESASYIFEQNSTHLVIQDENAEAIVHGIFAAWYHEKIPVLDPKKHVEIKKENSVIFSYKNYSTEKIPPKPIDLNTIYYRSQVDFSTSGSSGLPKNISKKMAYLKIEAESLYQLYSKKHQMRSITSVVLPNHIYGFLNTVVMAICFPLQIQFIDGMELYNHQSNIDTLIIVPALWDVSKMFLQQHQVRCLISSGSAFGNIRRQEICEFQNNISIAFEILGSTETGGIAYGSLYDMENKFLLFPNIKLIQKNDKSYICSPYLETNEAYPLDDKLIEDQNGYLKHQGRTDQIFKFGGKRYSLSEIENKILSIEPTVEVKSYFASREDTIKGGELLIWISHSHKTQTEWQTRLRQVLPVNPSKVIVMKYFPLDTNGKVSIANLMKLMT